MPRTLKQSARLGVSLISMLASGRPRYSASGWPTGASAGSSSRPEASLSRPSSFAEQSMPNDSTPRSFAALIDMPPTLEPTVASGAARPTRALGAPHTICSGSPLPMSTLHTCRRSASGWRTASMMRPTTTPARPSPRAVTSSTSRPMAVSVAASPSRLARVDTWLRSQFSGNFMGCRDSWFVIRDWKCRDGDGAVADPGWPAGRTRSSGSPVANHQSRPSGELPEEPHIVLEQGEQVVGAVTPHREALHAQAEGEAGVALRIDAAVAQHVRVDHAATQDLQPAHAAVRLLPGDVDLGARLHEREVAGAEAHLEVALEERAHELGERALEVGEGRGLVDQQALDLVEHRRMGLVGVRTVDLAGGDHAQRRPVVAHVAHLHARGVGAQQA